MSRLTASQRDRIASKDFAGPERSYPIEDASHARNALARVSQHGGSELKAKVRAKVAAKYPSIMQGEGDAPKARKDKPTRASGGPVKRDFGGPVMPPQQPGMMPSQGVPQNMPTQMPMQDLTQALGVGNPAMPPNMAAPQTPPLGGSPTISAMPARKRGGRLPKLSGGAQSGIGRLELSNATKRAGK